MSEIQVGMQESSTSTQPKKHEAHDNIVRRIFAILVESEVSVDKAKCILKDLEYLTERSPVNFEVERNVE